MKLQGMAGKGTGKLGSMVYATVRGAQIVRQYNPVVFNPNTEKQVKQRAKFALLAKLATSMNDALVFQGRGAMVSNRNAFIKENSGNFVEGTADIKFNSLSLTSGHVEGAAYPTVTANAQTHSLTISMAVSSTLVAGFGYAVIVASSENDGTNWIRAGIAMAEGGNTVAAAVNLPTSGSWGDAYVIGYPMYYKDGATRTMYEREISATNVTDNVLLSQFYNRMASVGDIKVYATKPLVKTT